VSQGQAGSRVRAIIGKAPAAASTKGAGSLRSRECRRIKCRLAAQTILAADPHRAHRQETTQARREPGVSESPPSDTDIKPRQFFVHGVTSDGHTFRPSDWAERLAGVLSCYRPGGMTSGRDAFIGYSPYVRPMLIGGVKCVLVDERLRDVERMAFDFVMNFAKDNGLPVYEGCVPPDRSQGSQR
jgi:Protein of unknown function (DUF3579)